MPRTAINLSVNQGAAVLELLERANVPPLPVFYSLLFDYVAGVKSLLSSRVANILADDHAPPAERLYSEFVEPYESREGVERATAQIAARLRTLFLLVGDSARASHEQSVALSDASQQFEAEQLDAGLIRDWIGRLEINNERMRRANAALSAELVAAQAELDEIRAEIARTREGSRRDPLTGVANRAGLDFALQQLISVHSDAALSCAVIDIDYFKSLNDSYGHQVGDQVLMIATRAIVASVRADDIVGRFGGDEFVVLFPETGLAAAHNVADGIRARIAASDLTEALGSDILGGITVSIGLAEYEPGEAISHFVDRADRCLYRAKRAGRNRVDSVEALPGAA